MIRYSYVAANDSVWKRPPGVSVDIDILKWVWSLPCNVSVKSLTIERLINQKSPKNETKTDDQELLKRFQWLWMKRPPGYSVDIGISKWVRTRTCNILTLWRSSNHESHKKNETKTDDQEELLSSCQWLCVEKKTHYMGIYIRITRWDWTRTCNHSVASHSLKLKRPSYQKFQERWDKNWWLRTLTEVSMIVYEKDLLGVCVNIRITKWVWTQTYNHLVTSLKLQEFKRYETKRMIKNSYRGFNDCVWKDLLDVVSILASQNESETIPLQL